MPDSGERATVDLLDAETQNHGGSWCHALQDFTALAAGEPVTTSDNRKQVAGHACVPVCETHLTRGFSWFAESCH